MGVAILALVITMKPHEPQCPDRKTMELPPPRITFSKNCSIDACVPAPALLYEGDPEPQYEEKYKFQSGLICPGGVGV